MGSGIRGEAVNGGAVLEGNDCTTVYNCSTVSTTNNIKNLAIMKFRKNIHNLQDKGISKANNNRYWIFGTYFKQ